MASGADGFVWVIITLKRDEMSRRLKLDHPLKRKIMSEKHHFRKLGIFFFNKSKYFFEKQQKKREGDFLGTQVNTTALNDFQMTGMKSIGCGCRCLAIPSSPTRSIPGSPSRKGNSSIFLFALTMGIAFITESNSTYNLM